MQLFGVKIKTMKKKRWYAITREGKEVSEEIVGFGRGLIFRRKDQAKQEFKLSGFKKRVRLDNGTIYKFRIRRIAI